MADYILRVEGGEEKSEPLNCTVMIPLHWSNVKGDTVSSDTYLCSFFLLSWLLSLYAKMAQSFYIFIFFSF